MIHNNRILAAKAGKPAEKKMEDCPYYSRGEGSKESYSNSDFEMMCRLTKIRIFFKTSKGGPELSESWYTEMERFGTAYLDSKCTNGDFQDCPEYKKTLKK